MSVFWLFSFVRISCVHTCEIPTSFATYWCFLPVGTCQLLQPSYYFSIHRSRKSPNARLFYRRFCPLLKQLYQSNTAVFLRELSPKNFAGAAAFVQYSFLACTWSCWFCAETEILFWTGWTHLHSGSFSRQVTASNMRRLSSHACTQRIQAALWYHTPFKYDFTILGTFWYYQLCVFDIQRTVHHDIFL